MKVGVELVSIGHTSTTPVGSADMLSRRSRRSARARGRGPGRGSQENDDPANALMAASGTRRAGMGRSFLGSSRGTGVGCGLGSRVLRPPALDGASQPLIGSSCQDALDQRGAGAGRPHGGPRTDLASGRNGRGCLLPGGDRRHRRRRRHGVLRNPFYAVLALVCHLLCAGGAVPAAARRVRRRRAGRRLRRRGDGALRLRGRLRRRPGRAAVAPAAATACAPPPRSSPARCSSSCASRSSAPA